LEPVKERAHALAGRGWLVVAIGYAISRALYAQIGVLFDDESLGFYWQFLDRDQLRDNLWQALFYQHTQPPLFNLYLGLGLQLERPLWFWIAGATAFGLMLHLGLYALGRRLGARTWLAAAVAIGFAFSPASILYETLLFYEYPVTALLTLAACCFYRAQRTQRARDYALTFGLLAAIVLTRSLFHLVWMLLAVLLAVAASHAKKRTLLAALVPVLLAASVYIKNEIVFGRFAASSWLGMSLSRLTTDPAPLPLRLRLLAQGRVSPLVVAEPWAALDAYPAQYRAFPSDLPRVAVLTATERKNAEPNYNNAAYLGIADAFLADARVLLRESPSTYLASVRRAWLIYFLPLHESDFLTQRRPPLRAIERVYEFAAGSGAFRSPARAQPARLEERMCWGSAWALPMILIASLGMSWRRRADAARATIVFCVGTVLWVALVGNQLEVGENNRFRLLTEPILWALAAAVFEACLVRAQRAWPVARARSHGA
jgi:4-amino-4-deoxy-L-arabinose transferase-like glycosyltransferase